MGACATKQGKSKRLSQDKHIIPTASSSNLTRHKRLEVPKLTLSTSQMYQRRMQKGKVSPVHPTVTQSTDGS